MLGVGEPEGFSLSLVTESFAVRALLGSVAAAGLAALLVGVGALRTSTARRLVLIAPAAVAAIAAATSVGGTFLPRMVVTSRSLGEGPLLHHLGEYLATAEAGMALLLGGYVVVAAVLVARRLLGLRSWRRLVAHAAPAPADGDERHMLEELAARMRLPCPELLLLHDCPGGAFTAGLRQPAVVIDPALMGQLDPEEREGLLAHELAHISRRDGMVGLAVGLVRDLAWFLVPLHLAAGWLRREQEEGADELASGSTGRPAALASGILKVWDAGSGRGPAVPATCAAAALVRVPSGVVLPGRSARYSWRIVTARVERLITRLPAPSRLRRRAEAAAAAGVLAVGGVAALTVPPWIASNLGTEEVAFLYLAGNPATSAEAPAFATFRALTPPSSAVEVTSSSGERPTTAAPAHLESRAELLSAERASVPTDGRLRWGDGERASWDVGPPGEVRRARPIVYTLGERGTQVGVFAVSAVDS